MADLEAEITEREMRLNELQLDLATPEIYRDGARVKETRQELDELEQKLRELYAHWEEAVELN